jgi:hypothetical protein
MATHDRYGTPGKMRELLAYHERMADALRTTIGLLNGHAVEKKQDKHQDLFDAVQLDAARRRNGAPVPRVTVLAKPPHLPRKKTKAEKRREMLQLLSQFNTETPIGPKGIGRIGHLLSTGYIKRKAGGYVRTDKQPPAL